MTPDTESGKGRQTGEWTCDPGTGSEKGAAWRLWMCEPSTRSEKGCQPENGEHVNLISVSGRIVTVETLDIM